MASPVKFSVDTCPKDTTCVLSGVSICIGERAIKITVAKSVLWFTKTFIVWCRASAFRAAVWDIETELEG